MELIYRGSRDGMTSNNFHNKCDNKGLLLHYIKMRKVFLEDFLQFHGQLIEIGILLKIVLYFH